MREFHQQLSAQRFVMAVGVLAVVHFSIGMSLWLVTIALFFRGTSRFGLSSPFSTYAILIARSGEAFFLLLASIVSIVIAFRSPRRGATSLVATLCMAVLKFAIDAISSNYDYVSYQRVYPAHETCHYCTWWWYSHPLR